VKTEHKLYRVAGELYRGQPDADLNSVACTGCAFEDTNMESCWRVPCAGPGKAFTLRALPAGLPIPPTVVIVECGP